MQRIVYVEGDWFKCQRCHCLSNGSKQVYTYACPVNISTQVVWRRTNMEYPLTIGEMTFSPDDEMTVDHSRLTKSSSSWDLLIKSIKPEHAGIYECQVSSNHLIAQYITLNVIGMYIY